MSTLLQQWQLAVWNLCRASVQDKSPIALEHGPALTIANPLPSLQYNAIMPSSSSSHEPSPVSSALGVYGNQPVAYWVNLVDPPWDCGPVYVVAFPLISQFDMKAKLSSGMAFRSRLPPTSEALAPRGFASGLPWDMPPVRAAASMKINTSLEMLQKQRGAGRRFQDRICQRSYGRVRSRMGLKTLKYRNGYGIAKSSR